MIYNVGEGILTYNDIEFFNVRDLTKIENLPGLRINRFSKEIIESFDEATPASFSRGCELRFVKGESGQITINLMAVDEDGEALLFFGDYMCSRHILPKGLITPIHINTPELLKKDFCELDTNTRFSKNICRVFFNNKAIIHYCGIDTYGNKIEPTKKEDEPKLSWLAYGSSITHGAGALSNYNSYIQQAARLLGSQVYNFGMSGACMCEKKMADFIAEQKDLDYVTLELGVNMREKYSQIEFEKRAKYLIEKVAENQKKVFLITIYPNIHTYYKETPITDNEISFKDILRKIASNSNFDNIYLIEGSDILTNFNTLTQDLIHPFDIGHMEMGYNLANKILQNII